MPVSDADLAARLLERLLVDPAFRARFRRNPAAACREAGLESLAEEMSLTAGKAMHTLDLRESRSSLGGVLMAAAMEGVGVYEFSERLAPHLDAIPKAVGDVLSRVELPALQGAFDGAPAEEPPAPEPSAEAAEQAAPAPARAASAAAAPPATAAPKEDAAGPEGGAKGAASAATPEEIAAGAKPDEAASAATPEEAASAPAAAPPSGTPAPAAVAVASPTAPAAVPEVAPAAAPEVAAPGAVPDPSQFGQEGTGGPPTAETKALLENPNVTFDDVGRKDLQEGRIDPRVVAVLTKLSEDHKITVSCMCSDHSKFTAGGSISNHFYGRGVDIAAIDGQPVNAGNAAAREVATELQSIDAGYRPNEVGTPWAIAAPGYFTDGGHQDHLHLGFKEALDLTKLPTKPAVAPAAAPAVAPAAAPAVPAAAAAAVAPPAPSDSLTFAAVETKAKAAGAPTAEPADQGSLAFIPAADAPAAGAQPAAAAPAAVVDLAGAPTEYPGDSASKEQLAAWMAGEAQKRGLPGELPVMASLVESGLTNIQGGDRDSVGFFQMRTGIWNQGEYAGYPDKPELQIKWFLDTAERVKEQRVARGLPIDDPSQFGEWIADVERPAEQYRGRYQLKLAEAQGLLRDAPPAAPAPGEAVAPAAPEPAAAPGPAGPVDEAAAAGSVRVDPGQYGAEGTGGPPDAATRALLSNPNVTLDANGRADLEAGRMDPRVVAVLTAMAKEHKLTVSSTISDHPKFTASGASVSNHYRGRGVDIATIDGQPVNASSTAAREAASNLAELPTSIRPSEVGTPWAIAAPGFFTDAGHQDHIHLAFDDPITTDWQPPTTTPAPATPTPAASPMAPGAVAAAAVAPPAPSDSLTFAIPAEAKAASERSNTLGFLPAAQPQPPGAAQVLKAVDPSAVAAAASPGAGPAPAARRPGTPAEPGTPEASASPPDLSQISGDYPGDDASKPELAKWMAKAAERRGLPPELPVMAGLVESGLANLSGGDRDSVGFFQMRVGIWNKGAYAGYPDRPDLQIKWFLDTAAQVKKQRVARGLPIDDPSQFGEWIADVERPAAQYRGRYQLRLQEARQLLKR